MVILLHVAFISLTSEESERTCGLKCKKNKHKGKKLKLVQIKGYYKECGQMIISERMTREFYPPTKHPLHQTTPPPVTMLRLELFNK